MADDKPDGRVIGDFVDVDTIGICLSDNPTLPIFVVHISASAPLSLIDIYTSAPLENGKVKVIISLESVDGADDLARKLHESLKRASE